ncbi:hypothetical protein B0A49_03162 [Cryomyces minteri]|uniref:Sphingolipid long chain base-responsive protein LSP1 n=1 Tax=Cryomyces minteri TaxID=331657 RepID=A0A4U0XSZ3_9PEZI|nr:hypothetical protein B0A49_03162 [Cryomyces minteri]
MAISFYPPPPPPPYSRTPSRSRSLNILPIRQRNRSLSVRSKKDNASTTGSSHEKSSTRHRFTMASLRGMQQSELSKKLYKLIKTENHAISAYEAAGRERASIASQLSDWGESTGDDAVSDISDKLGVLMAEIAEQEDLFAQNLEDSRGVLKQIRNTESSVQPSRDHKAKVADEIQKLKYKEPTSTKIIQLEQELVRAEAQSLVAEAQLTNITRQKFKEAYDVHFAATIERAEKQILLARQARRVLNLLDDTPIVPGDAHPAFDGAEVARQILNDAEDELRAWAPSHEPIHSSAGGLAANAMPASGGGVGVTTSGYSEGGVGTSGYSSPQRVIQQEETVHPAYRQESPERRETSAASGVYPGQTPYPTGAEETHQSATY